MFQQSRCLYNIGTKLLVPTQNVSRQSYLFHGNLSSTVLQRRTISMLERSLMNPDNKIRSDLDHAISMVKKFDPSGYLPGLLLSNKDAKIGYYAIRAFWIESGLRFKESPLNNSIAASRQIPGLGQRGTIISDDERIQRWKNGVEYLYGGSYFGKLEDNPTLRLLKHVVERHSLSKVYFDRIIRGREIDVNMKNYPTMKSLEDHVEMSCGSLLHLVLECDGITQNTSENTSNDDVINETARAVGLMHGLTNALRLSVPTASATGKVIIPQELCDKYEIKSPRYLLSALGMGDEECRRHLQSAVEDIANVARHHLASARKNIDDLNSHPIGHYAMSAFLPALACETFLNRLEAHNYDLTNRTLRNVGKVEHLQCAGQLVVASLQNKF